MCTSVGVRREKAKKGDADAMRMLGLRVFTDQVENNSTTSRRRSGGEEAETERR